MLLPECEIELELYCSWISFSLLVNGLVEESDPPNWVSLITRRRRASPFLFSPVIPLIVFVG